MFGSNSVFTRSFLSRLIDLGLPVRTLLLYGYGAEDRAAAGMIPVSAPTAQTPLVAFARVHDISIQYVHALETGATAQQIAELNADIMVIACFPRILPRAVWSLPRYGCLNVHPSLLPVYRGPAPLFWQFRDAIKATGVTLHRVDDEIDGGAVVAQHRQALPEGIGGHAADAMLARHGADLLAAAVADLVRGVLRPQPQDPARATYQPAPQAADFVLSPTWSARRAFDFMRGTEHWRQDYRLHTPQGDFALRSALAYDRGPAKSANVETRGDRLLLPFADGVLHARGRRLQ